MAKRTPVSCPLCGNLSFSVKICEDAQIICPNCGASLVITKNEDGSCVVSARPKAISVDINIQKTAKATN